MSKKKPLIVFEGIEGTGKTLHINNIAKFFKKKGIEYIKIREPGGSKNSESIRKIILNKKSNFNKLTDLFLYLAARNENKEEIIHKNYKKKIILIDRFTDSTLAYQHYGMGINKKLIILLNKTILKKIKPDFTFLYTINRKNLLNRLRKRVNKNRYDKFKYEFYNKVQKGFINLSKNKKKYLIIDSNNEIAENKKIILNKIKKII